MSSVILVGQNKKQPTGRVHLDLTNGRVRATGKVGRAYRRRIKREMVMQNALCRYCGLAVGKTLDHAVPVARGGDDRIDNLTLACGICNAFQSNSTLPEFRNRLRAMLANVEAMLTAGT